MNTAIGVALMGALALATVAPTQAASVEERYHQDLLRVVAKYQGAAKVPDGSVTFLSRFHQRTEDAIRSDLAAAEEGSLTPPPAAAPEPEEEEEAEVAEAPKPAPKPAAKPTKKRPPEKDLKYRKAKGDVAYQAVDEDATQGRSWVYHQYTDRKSQAYVDGLRVTDQGGDYRFEATAENLGRNDRNLRATYKGDRAKFSVQHDGTPHTFVVDGKTMFKGVGTTSLTMDPAMLADPAILGTATARGTRWMQEYAKAPLIDVGLQRDRTAFDLDFYGEKSDTIFKVTRDRRSGTRVGYAFDGNDRYELPIPIDYETMDYNLTTERSFGDFWLRASFLLSNFHNGNDTMTFQSGSRTAADVRSTNLLDLAPENQRSQYSIAGSVRNLAKDGRFNFNYAKGKMKQNDPLVAFSSSLAAAAPIPPQFTADQEVETTQFKVQYTMRPSDKTHVNLSYRGYEYEDEGSKIAFGGTANADGTFAADVTGARTTEHLSYERKTLDFQFGYDLNEKNNLQLRYSQQDIERHEREVAESEEDTWALIWDSRPNDKWNLRFSYDNADRDHQGYDVYGPFYAFITPPAIVPNNTPFMRKYDQASRERDQIKAQATFVPRDSLAVTFTALSAKNEYDEDNTFGMEKDDESLYGIDLDYRKPGSRWGVNFFANFETHESRMDSRDWQSGANLGNPYPGGDPGATTAAPIASDWSMDQEDDIDTFGFRFDWTFVPDKLAGQFGYTRAKNDTQIDFASPVGTGGGIPSVGITGPDRNAFVPESLPEISDMVQETYDLRFDYKLKRDRTLILGLRHETFEWKDWETAGWTPVNLTAAGAENGQNFIDQRPKDYSNTTIWFSMGFPF